MVLFAKSQVCYDVSSEACEHVVEFNGFRLPAYPAARREQMVSTRLWMNGPWAWILLLVKSGFNAALRCLCTVWLAVEKAALGILTDSRRF